MLNIVILAGDLERDYGLYQKKIIQNNLYDSKITNIVYFK